MSTTVRLLVLRIHSTFSDILRHVVILRIVIWTHLEDYFPTTVTTVITMKVPLLHSGSLGLLDERAEDLPHLVDGDLISLLSFLCLFGQKG